MTGNLHLVVARTTRSEQRLPAEAAEAVERAPEDDRAWLRESARRSHRLRHPAAGEIASSFGGTEPAGLDNATVVVRQIQPGMRVRRLARFATWTPLLNVEPVAHALYDLIAEGEPFTIGMLRARAAQYTPRQPRRQAGSPVGVQ